MAKSTAPGTWSESNLKLKYRHHQGSNPLMEIPSKKSSSFCADMRPIPVICLGWESAVSALNDSGQEQAYMVRRQGAASNSSLRP